MPLSYTSFSFLASRDPIRGHQRPATRAIVALDGQMLCSRLQCLNHRTVYRSAGLPSGATCTHWESGRPATAKMAEILVKGARWLAQPAAKRILVWYAEGVPSLPEVDESNSRFAKLRISTSVRKSRVENVMSRCISSGTSGDLEMLPIYAPRYSRVLYQQEEAFRARASSSIKSTTSCAVEIDVAHRHDSMRGPSTVNSPAASPRKRDNGVGTSSRQTQGPVLVTCLARGNPVGKMHIVPVLEPTSGKKWTITRRRAP
ncbi:hypothetical protein VTO73DRAFT_2397 [Trametes versicolor]